jgi:hypothetical protein
VSSVLHAKSRYISVVTFLILSVLAETLNVLTPIALEADGAILTDVTRLARTTIRYPLEASIVFWWKDENGTYRQEEGRGRDASDRGAFVFAVVCPPVGADIRIRISMEGFPDEAAALRIEVEGRVLRIDGSRASGENTGFAVLLSNPIVAGSEVRKLFFTGADHRGKEN